jgi:hypothetical protein
VKATSSAHLWRDLVALLSQRLFSGLLSHWDQRRFLCVWRRRQRKRRALVGGGTCLVSPAQLVVRLPVARRARREGAKNRRVLHLIRIVIQIVIVSIHSSWNYKSKCEKSCIVSVKAEKYRLEIYVLSK